MTPKAHLLSSAAHVGNHTAAHFTALACAGVLELICFPTLTIMADKVHHLSTPQILALAAAIFILGWVCAHFSLRAVSRRRAREPVAVLSPPPASDPMAMVMVIIAPASAIASTTAAATRAIADANRLLPPS